MLTEDNTGVDMMSCLSPSNMKPDSVRAFRKQYISPGMHDYHTMHIGSVDKLIVRHHIMRCNQIYAGWQLYLHYNDVT